MVDLDILRRLLDEYKSIFIVKTVIYSRVFQGSLLHNILAE